MISERNFEGHLRPCHKKFPNMGHSKIVHESLAVIWKAVNQVPNVFLDIYSYWSTEAITETRQLRFL